jgi:hypothetical protein
VDKNGCIFSCRPDDSDGATLLRILGPERVAALQAALGGKRVWIPKAGINFESSVCSMRDDCINTMRRQGLPVETISERLGVSPKTVYRVLRGTPSR